MIHPQYPLQASFTESLDSVTGFLNAAQAAGISSAEVRFVNAYDAMRKLADISLRPEGYEADRSRHHEVVIDCLQFTVGATPQDVLSFSDCRRKRHAVEYGITPSKRIKMGPPDIAALIRKTVALDQRVREWLRQKHKNLIDR